MDLSVEHLTKSRREFVRHARFQKKRREPVPFGALANGSLNVTTHGDDGYVSRSGVVLQILKKLPTAAIRHRQIGHDNVGVNLPRAVKGVGTICDRDHLETVRRKRECIERAGIVVTFDEKHERPDRRLPGAPAIHGLKTP